MANSTFSNYIWKEIEAQEPQFGVFHPKTPSWGKAGTHFLV